MGLHDEHSSISRFFFCSDMRWSGRRHAADDMVTHTMTAASLDMNKPLDGKDTFICHYLNTISSVILHDQRYVYIVYIVFYDMLTMDGWKSLHDFVVIV